ncbi:MAG: BrnT family toxin [Pyrinomonadaceae bacterium]
MKYFAWDGGKNELLKQKRGVSFEGVVFHIENGDVLDIVEHPNAVRYRHQKVYIVNLDGYAYMVPFIESEETVFLKTIIPSRKMTREYLYDQEDKT